MNVPPRPASLHFTADAYQPGTRHRPHRHDDLHFSMVLSGKVRESVGAVAEIAGALSVVAKDPDVVHANDFGSGVKLARLTLPGDGIGSLLDDPHRAGAWRWTHDPRVAAPFLRIVWRAGGSSAEFAVTDPDVVDLLAAFTARRGQPSSGVPPAWLRDLMTELREGWHPGMSVSALARRAGVHPVYLARCMRRWFQTSLAMELRKQRLRAAAAAIAESRRTISELAHSGGFSDEPHLIREFRSLVGLTPGRFRTLLGAPFRQRDVT